MKYKIILILCLQIFVGFTHAQKNISAKDFLSLAEEIVEDVEDENQKVELIEDLEFYFNSPVCLLNDDLTELVRLTLISQTQLEYLNNYRKWNKILSIYELQYVSGFDSHDMKRLIPFITIDCVQKPRSLKVRNVLNYGKYTFLVRSQRILEESAGYMEDTTNQGFLGSPYKVYLRANFSYGKRVSVGFTVEKDEGELFRISGNEKGFDFNSFHFQAKDIGIIKQINIGDFKAGFGQGLCFNSGYRNGVSMSNISSIDKVSQGLQKYSSVDENNFLRGIGIVLGNENLKTSIFISSKYRDGTLIKNDSDSIIGFSSFINTGIHNTELSLEKKHTLKENVYGLNVQYRFSKLHVGFVYSHVKYDYMKIENPEMYNLFSSNSRNFSNYGFYYRTRIGIVNLFGEFASDSQSRLVFINGLVMYVSQKSTLVFVHRYYPSGYNSPFGNSFGSSTSNQNEKGVYSAIDVSLNESLKLVSYFDYSQKPWLSYQLNFPGSESSFAIQLSYKYKEYSQLYFRIKSSRVESKDADFENGIDKPEEYFKRNLRIHNDLYISEFLVLRNRIEYNEVVESNEKQSGWLVYQDLRYKSNRIPLVVTFRYSMFDTDNWEARIYSWEHDVLYSYSSPANYMKGSRMYLVGALEINEKLKVWGKVSRTTYSNQNSIGTGLAEILGNHKTEFRIMLRIKI